jgi:hypothetical protein
MGYFYFDESIHERAGFILGAFVFGAEDPDPDIVAGIRRCGLDPLTDEFKSSVRMDDNPKQVQLREALQRTLRYGFRLGVVVVPSAERSNLGREALLGLTKIISANDLTTERHEAHFDEGVFSSKQEGDRLARAIGSDRYCELQFRQDSRLVRGLQLADLVAHTCATMLLETLGVVTKDVKAGPGSGYDPDLDLNLGFELWAGIRYQFFNGGLPERAESLEDMVVDVANYGLHIAKTASDELRSAALKRFGESYYGCIH